MFIHLCLRHDVCLQCSGTDQFVSLVLCCVASLYLLLSRHALDEDVFGVVGPFISQQMGGQPTVSIYTRLASLTSWMSVLIFVYRWSYLQGINAWIHALSAGDEHQPLFAEIILETSTLLSTAAVAYLLMIA
jgi:hypothetical protein